MAGQSKQTPLDAPRTFPPPPDRNADLEDLYCRAAIDMEAVCWNLATAWARDTDIRELKLLEMERILQVVDFLFIDEGHASRGVVDAIENWGNTKNIRVFCATKRWKPHPTGAGPAKADGGGCVFIAFVGDASQEGTDDGRGPRAVPDTFGEEHGDVDRAGVVRPWHTRPSM